jgi:hypothetical protein
MYLFITVLFCLNSRHQNTFLGHECQKYRGVHPFQYAAVVVLQTEKEVPQQRHSHLCSVNDVPGQNILHAASVQVPPKHGYHTDN